MMLSAAAAALRLEAAVASVPHPAKAQTGGEDAHLLLPAPRPGDHVVGAYGVFDGVGGWADEGIDALLDQMASSDYAPEEYDFFFRNCK